MKYQNLTRKFIQKNRNRKKLSIPDFNVYFTNTVLYVFLRQHTLGDNHKGQEHRHF